jgi:hypothetical protein
MAGLSTAHPMASGANSAVWGMVVSLYTPAQVEAPLRACVIDQKVDLRRYY